MNSSQDYDPFITDALIDSWEEKLSSNSNSELTKLTSNDTNLEDYDLTTHPELRTIKNDVDRTRIRERANFPNFASLLKNLLIYYCKLNDVEYKQGMNEVMAPFILLQEKLSPSNMSIPRIVNLFSYFVDNFLTNYFYEKDLFAFKSSVSLLTLLLRYHDPELHNIFESVQISPQMYATNWLLTTNANKHSIDIVYKLWDYLIKENDQLFIHFIVIAFLKENRDNFKSTESATIPILFSKCCITSDKELSSIIQHARVIRQNTPNSFRLLVNKLEIFKPRSTKLKIMYEKFNTDEMISLPILASEVLYNEFKNEIYCADSQCKHYIKSNTENDNQGEFECYFCKNGHKSLKHDFLLIDLRINANNEGTLNILSENYFLSQKQLQSEDVGKILYENIEHHKGKKHIILVTSDTDYFEEYEERFFIQQTNNAIKGHIQINDNSFFNSILNDKEVKALQKLDKSHSQLDMLQEYKNIKRIIYELLNQNFPYVSYSYHGFKEIHELCIRYNFLLENHNNKKCQFCLIDQDKNATIECYTKIFSKKQQSNQPTQNVNNQLYQNIPVVPRSESELMKQKLLDEKSKQQMKNEQEVKVDTFIEPIELITQERMNKYLTDTSNIVFHCNLLEHNMHEYKEKITIIVFYDCVKFFKMRIRGNQIFFDLLASVKYDLFKKINRDKNVFNVFYTKDNYTHDLKVDLYTDIDADNFFEVFSNDIIEQ